MTPPPADGPPFFGQVLMLVGDTIGKRRRTGIQRVVIETARSLIGQTSFDLVRWDAVEGRLRFLDAAELDGVFGPGAWPPGLKARLEARRVGRPFHEQLDDPASTWILAPEVGWHEPNGVEIMARALSHCRQWGGRFAAIFYDLIPIRNPVYSGGAEDHEAYLAELARMDLIIPISQAAGQDLERLWRERGVEPHPPVRPLLLPDGGFGGGAGRWAQGGQPSRTILLFGTVEPRKRQVEVLQAMAAARTRSPEVAAYEAVVVGSLHGAVAHAFNGLVAANPWIRHLDYVDDRTLDQLIGSAAFTVFASDDEGYGLPIAESLAAGIPCLCADFGSMAEIAAGGGCLTVDVRRQEALEAAILELCGQPETLKRLRAQIAARRFDSWACYAGRLLGLLQAHSLPEPPAPVAVETAAGAPETFERLAHADLVVSPDPAAFDAFVGEAARRAWPALLPETVAAEGAEAAEKALAARRSRRHRTAALETAYAQARRAAPQGLRNRPVFLRVLISTYNRCDFVVANVRWILGQVFRKLDFTVDLVVVDGGSTDATVARLHGISDKRLRVVQGAANVGMLAGLREAARNMGAEYVWLVGDDDFIDPEAFAAIGNALKGNPGTPFAFTNFSVYHRAALGPADTVRRLVLEGRPVAEASLPSRLAPIRDIAAQTDNLFTAIYTIVWRADLLSATYERHFDGPAFEDLSQAIPCTEFILQEYGDCQAWWNAGSGVTGNAHNSWSRHRPRWHAVIMPLAFALAREAGVDPVKLQTWAGVHRALLDEALAIGREQGWTARFGPAYADLARRVFRALPPGFEP